MIRRMRRGLSIFLVLFFLLSPLASALDAGQDASLPACCRRHGTHHCAMVMQTASTKPQAQPGTTPVVSAPLTCPYYPGTATLMTGPAPALASTASGLPADLAEIFARVAWQLTALSRPSTKHAGRGPPAAI
jgi:hypothetical protein